MINSLKESYKNGTRVSVNKLPSGEASFRYILRTYKHGAKKRNIDFKLTNEEFKKIIVGDCVYCGAKPIEKARKTYYNGTFTCNGIDRIDSSRGYEIGNVVCCCGRCNWAKMDENLDDFLKWRNNLVNFVNKQNENNGDKKCQ